MRDVPPQMENAWLAEDKTGPRRPVARATIQRVNLQRFDYDTSRANGGDWDHQKHRMGNFTSIIFGDESPAIELRNIQSLTWRRSLDQDVAEATLVLKNVEYSPVGDASAVQHDDFDQPGRFTPNRGDTDTNFPWDYPDDGWRNLIVPDRLVRTYEGYGADLDVAPALDENLLPSGVWLIDRVELTSDTELTITMRDVGRLLLGGMVFPPCIPYAEYPLSWSTIRTVQVNARDAKGGEWKELKRLGTATSSNSKYIGKGLVNPPYPNYVGPNGGFNGHHANHVLEDDDFNARWQSTGQESARSHVWWEVDFDDPQHLAGVKIDPHGGPYRIYISVKTADGWIGRKKVPYKVTTEGVDLDAKIPFVKTVRSDRFQPFDVILPRKYRNVKKLRLTFTDLAGGSVGKYPYSAKLSDVRIYTAPNFEDLSFGEGQVARVVGNYRDYTDIVKWICAWGGWFWPSEGSGRDFYPLGDGQRQHVHYVTDDPVLPKGRVWGDFMKSGTAGEADLTIDLFDKQPLMDCINYVRDILGFVFFIDETGAVVWRMPNLWAAGNYKSPSPHARRTRRRQQQYLTLSDEEQLIDINTALDSENARERIFVANSTGRVGIVVRGHLPTHAGLRRVAGWTDQHFKTRRETRVMADMIAARQMFDYRRSTITIPGYPGIQMDDQVKVRERVTNDAYFHYVLGIDSQLNMATGEWTYTLQTHWLGENQTDAWKVNPHELDIITQNYLQLLSGDTEEDDQ